jgi:hypothetical protein
VGICRLCSTIAASLAVVEISGFEALVEVELGVEGAEERRECEDGRDAEDDEETSVG